jgi:hypothetical protein
MQIIINDEELERLNEIIGSLMIKQFNGKGAQERYRKVITHIFLEFFKPIERGTDNE